MQPNGSVAYTITVSNAGPSDAPTVIVSDYLSESMLGAITSASLGTPALENGATDTGATLGASFPYTLSDTVDLAAPVSGSPNSGGWVQYVISATISASAAGTLANTASVSVAGTGVTNTGTTPVTDNDTLAKCDLVWSLSGQKTAVAGHDVIYQINVSNYGPGEAQTVTITDTLPAGMTYFSATGSNLTMGLAKTVGSVVVFSGTMAVGASETIAIDATVSSSVASGKTLTNSVTVSSGRPVADQQWQAADRPRPPHLYDPGQRERGLAGAGYAPRNAHRNDGPGDHRRARRQQHDPGLARDRRLRGLRRRPRAGNFRRHRANHRLWQRQRL